MTPEPVYFPWWGNRSGVLLKEGPEQSLVRYDHDRREVIMINTWFKRGTPRVKERVKLKTTKRVYLERR